MHIRTMGELHDTINAQAKEIDKLKGVLSKSKGVLSKANEVKADLSKTKKELRLISNNYKAYRRKNKLTQAKTRTARLRDYITNNSLERKNKKVITELADKFDLSIITVRNVCREVNKRGAAL